MLTNVLVQLVRVFPYTLNPLGPLAQVLQLMTEMRDQNLQPNVRASIVRKYIFDKQD